MIARIVNGKPGANNFASTLTPQKTIWKLQLAQKKWKKVSVNVNGFAWEFKKPKSRDLLTTWKLELEIKLMINQSKRELVKEVAPMWNCCCLYKILSSKSCTTWAHYGEYSIGYVIPWKGKSTLLFQLNTIISKVYEEQFFTIDNALFIILS